MIVRALIFFVLVAGWANAQVAFYRVPDAWIQRFDTTVQVQHQGRALSYVAGVGWQPSRFSSNAKFVGQDVYVDDTLLDYLGATAPRLSALRVRDEGASVRIVLDIGDPQGLGVFGAFERSGEIDDDTTLQVNLPELMLPLEVPTEVAGLELSLINDAGKTLLSLGGDEVSYRIFSLQDPARLVIDLSRAQLAGGPDVRDATRPLGSGVVYRRFQASTAAGTSGVHLLEIAPGAGEFRVVGESAVPRTLSELASGGLAAINASYFDTQTFSTIGLLKVDYTELSPPSRGRASVGFGAGQPVIGRVQTTATVQVEGRSYAQVAYNQPGSLALYTTPGRWVGQTNQGAIVVANDRVLENRVGPRRVPPGGFVLAYDPTMRELALIDPGARASARVDISPNAFERVRYAVEAGPLLVAEGRPALEPGRESFATGTRILDGRTQQSAIGVRADGTVLMLVADAMIASELVPLFISLGAEYAMRLDSGSSAALYANGRVLNRNVQRQIVSAIVLVPN
ncbi:MAG: phosphodiester glycosidase family protein [Trueperaceae bacterium]|nr:phosphodiester glycosidase family protein [Trueperaceae bacterium]